MRCARGFARSSSWAPRRAPLASAPAITAENWDRTTITSGPYRLTAENMRAPGKRKRETARTAFARRARTKARHVVSDAAAARRKEPARDRRRRTADDPA